MGFPGEQLDLVVKAMPDMTGFCGYFDDGAALELAMESLSAEDLEMIFALMKHGSRTETARKLSEGSIKKTIEIGRRVKEALASLQKEFDGVMRKLYP